MQDIIELQRRITAAMDRIAYGVEQRATAGQGADADAAAEITRLTEALDEERMTNAQLNERVRVLREKEAAHVAEPETVDPEQENLTAQLADLKAQLAAQTDEIFTLRRVLAEAGKEITTLRAARNNEAAELAEIVAALDPLVTQAQQAPSATETPHA